MRGPYPVEDEEKRGPGPGRIFLELIGAVAIVVAWMMTAIISTYLWIRVTGLISFVLTPTLRLLMVTPVAIFLFILPIFIMKSTSKKKMRAFNVAYPLIQLLAFILYLLAAASTFRQYMA